MEGVLQGGIGALLALAALALAFLRGPRAATWCRWRRPLNLSSVRFLSPELCAAARGGRDGGRLPRRAGRRARPACALQNLDTRFHAALHWVDSGRRDNSPPRTCMPRFVTDSRPISAQHPITEFYREEFVKHHRCLQQHRPYFSESAITDVEAALTRIMGAARAALLARTTPTNWSAPSSRNSTS